MYKLTFQECPFDWVKSLTTSGAVILNAHHWAFNEFLCGVNNATITWLMASFADISLMSFTSVSWKRIFKKSKKYIINMTCKPVLYFYILHNKWFNDKFCICLFSVLQNTLCFLIVKLQLVSKCLYMPLTSQQNVLVDNLFNTVRCLRGTVA